MRGAAALAILAVLMTPVMAYAQASDSDLHDTLPWRPDLVAHFESEGGQNVPNYLYDGPHGHRTAGGVCQMVNTTWRRIAPMIDIDIQKFDTAGSATEFDQWRACWKLWSVDGYKPWACCNAELRRALDHLADPSSPRISRRPAPVPVLASAPSPATPKSAEPPTRIERYSARLSASSDVYHSTFGVQSDGMYGIGVASR